MGDWFNLRVKVPTQQLNSTRNIIRAWPQKVAAEVYYPKLTQIAQEGRDYMRYIILAASTPTGVKRQGQGGNGPGRVNTGQMFDSVRYRVRQNKYNYSATIGWLDGKPGYAIFQELGTKNGVVGMNAVAQANEYMLSEIRALAAGRLTSTPVGPTSLEG